ncbi:MAG TPA: penicillin acylase family protein, partial [Xanthomonadales bacterium]|nr:penicillin acylase family protein [Xanthomonadales bacterium]
MTKRPLVTALVVALLGASPLSAQTITAPGLKAPGSISYDAEGVPTVLAASDEDAAYLLGYGHARDRFFQMDYLRRVGSGTYAELVGAAALANDVQLRTLGIRRSAWETYAATNPKLRGIATAYANGVNAWLRTNPLPVEYAALELTRAEPWSPVDTFVIGKLLTFQLGFDDDTGLTVRLGTYQQAGVAGGFDGTKLFFDDLTRSKPADGRVTVPNFLAGIGGAETEKSASDTDIPMIDPATLEAARQHVDNIKDNPWLAPMLEVNTKRGGSNWWLIGGS